MRFYSDSRAARITLTALMVATASMGLFTLIHRRWFLGISMVINGGFSAYGLWNRYWELPGDGTVRSKGTGGYFVALLSSLRYVGPVREDVSFPVSKKKDLELEIAGARSPRYARIKDQAAFLQQLRQAAPQAEIPTLELPISLS